MDMFRKLIKYMAIKEYREKITKGLKESIDGNNQKIEAIKTKIKAEQLELKGKKITLTENIVLCGQDFRFFRGAPTEVEFTIDNITERDVVLRGPGHGEEGNYGNGAIHVTLNDLVLWFEKQEEKKGNG